MHMYTHIQFGMDMCEGSVVLGSRRSVPTAGRAQPTASTSGATAAPQPDESASSGRPKHHCNSSSPNQTGSISPSVSEMGLNCLLCYVIPHL